MNNQDEKLRGVLRQWKDIAPRGNFESNVWRRIRRSEQTDDHGVGWALWWRRALGGTSLPVGVAVIVAVMIGGVSGWQTSRATQQTASPLFRFLSSDSLAGGYIRGTQGGNQP